MKKSSKRRCPQCRILEADLASVKADMARLREELAALRKTSSTSSKPPSTDIVKPKPATNEEDGPKRTIGGQPGHPKHEREPFPTEQVTKFLTHTLDACPDCGGRVRRNGPLQSVVQQMDVVEIPISIEQHTCPQYWCARCRKPCSAALPLPIERGGLLGPNLTALIAFMKGGCHASFSTIRTFLRDVVGVTVARSTLDKTIKKVSAALEGPYEELAILLPFEDVRDRLYGERLREAIRELFGVIHRRDELTAAEFARQLRAARDWVLYRGLNDVPPTRKAQNIAERFRKHGEAYFTFVTTPDVEPTNNLAEQAIRFVVIDRLITQGTRSEAGQQWCERIWTAMATCARQGRSAYAFLAEAIFSWFEGKPGPSLLPEMRLA